jgi:5'-deoxynucleotidase YfbR-like HD superfamily hydrolase
MSAIKTFSGIMFDPTIPQPELIQIADIAHALPMLCRANGHFKTFYSVGQHSINCAREAAARGYSLRVQLGCLLHDGSEAYLSDVTRPVKQAMPVYLQIEEPLQNTIWDKWLHPRLTEEEIRQIFLIDDVMLLHEFLELMDTALADEIPPLCSQPEFTFRGFQETTDEFLALFQVLTEAISKE